MDALVAGDAPSTDTNQLTELFNHITSTDVSHREKSNATCYYENFLCSALDYSVER